MKAAIELPNQYSSLIHASRSVTRACDLDHKTIKPEAHFRMHFLNKRWTCKQLLVITVLLSTLLVLRFLVYSSPDALTAPARSFQIPNSYQKHRNEMKQMPRRNGAENIRPEILTHYPGPFITQMKNPCWLSPKDDLYCLPYFYLAGMPKCGTTDIWEKLTKHPQVWGSSKESHWWAKVRVGRHYGNTSLTTNATSYYQRWGKMIRKVAKQKGKEYLPHVIVGDGSASTFWDNRFWSYDFPNLTVGPPFTTPSLIHGIQPKAKVIVAFRNPVERLYSDYTYFAKHHDPSPQHFHNATKVGIEAFHECLAAVNDLRTCAYQPDVGAAGLKPVRLLVGLYTVFLEDWLKQFPRSQIFIIKTEEWSENCPTILSQLHKFLDLDEMSSEAREQICSERYNVGKTKTVPMLPETEQLLRNFYAPYNDRLARLLSDENFLW